MKRKIFRALVALTALVFASCSMFNMNEKQEEDKNDKTAYITIGLNEQFRTALPTVSGVNDFDSFILISTIVTEKRAAVALVSELGRWSTDSTSTAYEKMTDAIIAVNPGLTYKFTLTATKGGAAWQGEIEKTIEAGTNSLSFSLTVAGITNQGKGSLSITLSVPEIVKAVDAELKTMDETQIVKPKNAEISFANGKATYMASDIAAGNYVLVFTLWGDEDKRLKLNQWREYAGIADGLTSSSNPVIARNEDVGEIYTITLYPNGGTLEGTFPGSYTRFSDDIVLPQNAICMNENGILSYPSSDDDFEIYRRNYLFEGWYDAETDGNLVESISSGSTGNKTLYAKWTDTFTVAVDELISYESVGILGEYLENSLKYLKAHNFDGINLKLIDMEDAKALADLSTFDFQSKAGYEALNDYVDERFTKIFNAICAAQGTLTPKGSSLGWGNGNIVVVPTDGYTYDGLSINLDLSETRLTYLPAYAFADSEKYASGKTSISTKDLKKPVNLIGITLPESLTTLLPYTFVYSGFTTITIPKNVTFMNKVFVDTEALTIDFESGSSIETIDKIAAGQDCLYAIIIPASVKEIKDEALAFTGLTGIAFEGTKEQWKSVKRGSTWCALCPVQSILCSDGEADLDYGAYNIIVVPNEHGGVKTNSIASTVGTEVILTIAADDEYIFDSISVTAGGNPVTLSGTGATRTFLMPESEVTVTATFKKIEPITVKGSELDTLKDKLLEMKEKGISCITVKVTDMADAIAPATDWSTINLQAGPGEPSFFDYIDERFATIFDAIYDVQGEIERTKNSETGEWEYSYAGIGVKLDLSGTSLTYIPFAAFADMSGQSKKLLNLTEINLPQTLTALIPASFVNTGITEITIPKNVTYINKPFITGQVMTINFESGSCIETIYSIGSDMCLLDKITIPASVKEIKAGAFYESCLTEITFEEGSQLETIGERAFSYCDLETITLPASLESIGACVFDACNDLKTIKFTGTARQWSDVDFDVDWYEGIPATIVSCSDYDIPIMEPYFPESIGPKTSSETKEVGDIVFSDGSAMSYDDFLSNNLDNLQKLNAVAVIFYKGTGLNSGNDTTTVRTLGVGIYNKELSWCTTNANAYNLSIDTIKCKPDTSEAQSEIFSFTDTTANDRNGKDNLSQIATFLTSNGKNDDTGDASKYPAFNFAKNYDAPGPNYDSGWYLPSLAEFYELYKNGCTEDFYIGDVISAITDGDYTIYFEEEFWTSTQVDYNPEQSDIYDEDYCNKSAYGFFHYDDGIWPASFPKEGKYNTCVIREF